MTESPISEADRIEDELIADVAKYSHDPFGYIVFAYPWGEVGSELENESGPRFWQKEVCGDIRAGLLAGLPREQVIGDVLAKFDMLPVQVAVASGHGIGKSGLVGMLIDWAMSTCQNTRGIVTANTDTQLRTKTWPEVKKWHRLSITSHWFECTATSIHAKGKAGDTWRIDAIPWSKEHLEAFAGLHNKGNRILLVFDEASAIADGVWEVAEGALTDEDTEIIWLCFGNPTRNSGRFRECFRKNAHRWAHRQVDSRTVPGTNKTKIAQWVQDHGEDSDFVKVRVRGMFPTTSAAQFIATEDVDAAYGKDLRVESYNFAPKIITCDPSWTGDDPLVIGLRQGLMFKILREMPKNDNDVQVATILAMLQDEHQADAVFIDAGYGTGIYSAGITMKRQGWQMVWFGSAAPDPGFINMRAWIWNQVKQWLKQGGSIQPDPGLHQELTGPETIPRLDGKIQLESKQDMKDRGLPSPNKADALAISFAFPVAKLNGEKPAGTRPAVVIAGGRDKYNPLSRGRR